jgi:putative transposase
MLMYEYRKLSEEERAAVVAERINRGYPPHRPPHPIATPGDFLITAACYEHAPYINTPERRDELMQEILQQTSDHGIAIKGWVVLPHHYHFLGYVPEVDDLSPAIRKIHGPSAVAWNRVDHTAGRKVWFNYSDRAIRSERHYYTTLDYIHYNPVKHGLVNSPYDWPWSSIGWYVEYYGRDWLRDAWVTYPVLDYRSGWDD